LAWAYLDLQAEIEEEDMASDIEKRSGILEFQP